MGVRDLIVSLVIRRLDAEATARLKYNINELCVRSGPETPILTSIGITVPADTGMKRMNMMATALSID